MEVEQALANLKQIKLDFAEFLRYNKHITEADTRINLIDKILNQVLFWPAPQIRREPRADNGYLDYSLKVNNKEFICVEAKKKDTTFIFPNDKLRKYYKLGGVISTNRELEEAIIQVRGYCDDLGIRFAIITNGDTWVIFRAIRDDMPWREGTSRVFYSIDNILDNFIEFWNLLSFSSIIKGSLDSEFSSTAISNRSLSRVLNFLLNPDVPLLRNNLHTELHPVIQHFFEDITDPNYLETLENCYVYSKTVTTVNNDLNFVIRDSIPKFLQDGNTDELIHKENDAGKFGKAIQRAFQKQSGQLFLLLGGIGAGKTTFQKRYQLTVGKELLNENAIWFSIDFLKPPSEDQLEDFVWQTILNQLREKYSSPYLETRQNIKRAYKAEIDSIKQTSLYNLKEDSREYDLELNKYLAEWQRNLPNYIPRLLQIAKSRKKMSTVLFFDNVDQLSPSYQAKIFLLAQRITDLVGSISIVALREESYYTANIQKVFTAYINRKFHIASPAFRKMISHRIKYVLNIIDNTSVNKFPSLAELTHKQNISDFLKIVEKSIFEKNKNIASFIEHLCFGNMRVALQMFSTFLVSGATDVEKMLRIYRREGNYFVAFHEFLRSIMLGERFYYKDSQSVVLNLFECGQEKNSSHFTSIRILSVLEIHRTESNKEGEGFFETDKIISIFEDIFNNREDLIKSLQRLLSRQLIETNTKSEDVLEATHIRLTSAGWYYLKVLLTSFAYLDLAFQDTPINDEYTLRTLVASMKRVNNLSDPEETKIERMQERFTRVEVFLFYLEMEEQKEMRRFNLLERTDSNPVYNLISPQIRDGYSRQKERILKRLQENREKYEEDLIQNAILDFSDVDVED